jgi:hypothetical protein
MAYNGPPPKGMRNPGPPSPPPPPPKWMPALTKVQEPVKEQADYSWLWWAALLFL